MPSTGTLTAHFYNHISISGQTTIRGKQAISKLINQGSMPEKASNATLRCQNEALEWNQKFYWNLISEEKGSLQEVTEKILQHIPGSYIKQIPLPTNSFPAQENSSPVISKEVSQKGQIWHGEITEVIQSIWEEARGFM